MIAQLCGLESVPASSKAQEWLAAIPDERVAAAQLEAWAATVTDTSLLSDEAARSLLSSPGGAGPTSWHLDTGLLHPLHSALLAAVRVSRILMQTFQLW